MATTIPSQQDLYNLFKNEVQSRAPQLTDFADGSNLDAIAGGLSVGGEELAKIIIEKFNKTFFETSHGPEITEGADDLQILAKDHFGESFARPAAEKATTTVDFSRPTSGAGNVTIPAGTIVKSVKDSNGNEQRFATLSEVTMVTLIISASVEAIEAGTDGNVSSATLTVIEDSLTDNTVVVTNPLAAVGGEAADTDAEYREFIRNLIEVIRGATKAAIEAAAVNVAGVDIATAIEDLQTVIEWDIGTSMTVGDFFTIPRVRLFIADVNGTASQALIDAVEAAIFLVRACGVKIIVVGAVPLSVDWTATLTLNPSGPNFAEFTSDTTRIVEQMEQHIRDLPIGTGFNRAIGRAAILALFGSAGTDDLSDFSTSVPAGDIAAAATEKLIPGTVTTT